MKNLNNPPIGETCEINFAFREKLNAVTEGFRHNYCYQCGACVADCPANNYSTTFNPRLIILKALLGFEDELISADSEIWNCTNCYTCSERCPQDVRPIDVIIALKNLCTLHGKSPELILKITQSVLDQGITTKVTSLAHERREEYNLPPLKETAVEEIQTLLKGD